MGLTPSVPLHYVSMPSPWLDASHPIGLAPLEAEIEHYQAQVIVIDNLLLIKGSIEENSAGMGVVMAYLRQLTERYTCVVIPIHHQRKDHGTGGRSGDRLRGHSSIEAALDLALLVEREDGSNTVTVRSTKTRGADVAPFGAMFTYEHQPGTSELYRARFYGVPIAQDSAASGAVLVLSCAPVIGSGLELAVLAASALPANSGLSGVWSLWGA
jgi:AAA domain